MTLLHNVYIKIVYTYGSIQPRPTPIVPPYLSDAGASLHVSELKSHVEERHNPHLKFE
jgi:hypothetical protein